jgi:hypothetical protein
LSVACLAACDADPESASDECYTDEDCPAEQVCVITHDHEGDDHDHGGACQEADTDTDTDTDS